jgi:beta-barrel assembly-enhancing protease
VAFVRQLERPLDGRDARTVLAGLPHRSFDNTIVLRADAEQLLGRALVANLASASGFVDNPRLVEYVNGVAAVVGAHVERLDLPFRVGILKDAAINGFGLPSGYIIVTKGLIDDIRDEAELACVLGHEMAHTSLYHGLREFKKREIHRRRDAAFEELDRVSGGSSDKEIEKDLDELADTAYLKIMGGRAREDELEADLFGAAYAAAAGYDPRAMLDVLRRIEERHATGEAFRHHPPVNERIAKLDAAIRRYHLAWSGQKRLADRYTQMTAPAAEPSAAKAKTE